MSRATAETSKGLLGCVILELLSLSVADEFPKL